MKTVWMVGTLTALSAVGCGDSGGGKQDPEVQKGVEAVAKALADKADECGYQVDKNATFQCDGSVTDAAGLRACAASLAPLTCEYLDSVPEGKSETKECEPFQDVCSVR